MKKKKKKKKKIDEKREIDGSCKKLRLSKKTNYNLDNRVS